MNVRIFEYLNSISLGEESEEVKKSDTVISSIEKNTFQTKPQKDFIVLSTIVTFELGLNSQ